MSLNIVVRAIDQITAPFKRMGAGILSALPGPAGVAVGAVLAIGAAAVAVGAQAVQMAGNFQAGTMTLVTGAGESLKNLQMVRDGILGLAVSTGTTTAQLTSGMYMIESAGFHGANGLAVLKAAAQGAKVGNADLGVVSNATTTIMTDFGISAGHASIAVNTMIATVANGKTTMQALSGSLSQILPTASSARIGLNDTMAAMATMTGEGVPAANAATYLRQTILGLIAPSKGTVTALAGIGLTSKQVSDEMKISLPAALQMITDHLAKKFPPGSAAYVNALKNISGGAKTMQGMLDLTGTHLQTFKNNVTNIAGAVTKGGNSITGWALVQSTWNQQMSQAKEVVETLMIKIGTALLPVVQRLMGAILPVVTRFGNWITSGNRLQTAMGAVGNVVKQVGSFVTGTLLPPIMHLAQSIFGVIQRFIEWNNKTHLVQTVLSTIGGIIRGVAGFVGGLIDKIASLVTWFTTTKGGGVALYTVLGVVATILSVNAVQAVAAFVASIPGVVAGFATWAIGAWATAAANIAAFWPIYLVVGIIIGVIGLVILAVKNWGAIAKWLQGVWNGIKGFFAGLWNWIVGLFKSAISKLSGLFNILKIVALIALAPIVLPILGIIMLIKNWGHIVTWLKGIWGDLVSFFQGIGSKIGSAFSALGSTVKGVWTGITSAFKGAIDWIIGGINSFIGFVNHISIPIPAVNLGPIHIGGGTLSLPKIPTIPLLASGGYITAGGLAGIHERGAEVVKLPTGSAVYPHGSVPRETFGGGTGGHTTIYNITINAQGANAHEVYQLVKKELAKDLRKSTNLVTMSSGGKSSAA
jgi:TP901 family phage tail tape measure protein